jgi:hypothetical protein
MMKKLLVLMLVFGTASLANAALTGIQLSVNGQTDEPGNVTEVTMNVCDELVIDVYGPQDYLYLGYIIIEGEFPGAGGEWGDHPDQFPEGKKPVYPDDYLDMGGGYYYLKTGYPQVLAGAGDMGGTKRYKEEGWGFGYEVSAAQSEGTLPGGEEFRYIYHCCGPGIKYVTISLWDDDVGYGTNDVQDTIVIHQIPEPATIALLGLGGLLMRRRKK